MHNEYNIINESIMNEKQSMRRGLFVRNSDVHRVLRIPGVVSEIMFRCKRETRLRQHTNVEAVQLLDNGTTRKLKFLWADIVEKCRVRCVKNANKNCRDHMVNST